MTLDPLLIERVTRKVVRDPALAKLLHDLPKGDPDAPEPDLAEIWIAFCDRRQTIPIGKRVDVDFGYWRGPPMLTEDILIHAKSLRTGAELSVRVGNYHWNGPKYTQYGGSVRAYDIVISIS